MHTPCVHVSQQQPATYRQYCDLYFCTTIAPLMLERLENQTDAGPVCVCVVVVVLHVAYMQSQRARQRAAPRTRPCVGVIVCLYVPGISTLYTQHTAAYPM